MTASYTPRLTQLALWALLLGLLGCVPTAHIAHPAGVDGVARHTIRCNYAGRPERTCYEDAAKVCAGAYEVLAADRVGAFGTLTLLVRCAS